MLCKYSKQIVKLGTRVLIKVTKVDIPQKEVYVDIKDIIKENNKAYAKRLEK